MVKILSESFISIDYYPLDKMLHVEWRGAVPTENFKRGADIITGKCLDFEIEHLIIDTRAQATVQKEATDYASMKIQPLLEHHLRQVLFVLPQSTYTQMSVEMFRQNLDGHKDESKIKYFTSLTEAFNAI